jgi:predicted hydrocarbon binding protein
MLWDPKRFPMMKYRLNKEDWTTIGDMIQLFPWRMRLGIKFMPKSFNKTKDMKKMLKAFSTSSGSFEWEHSGIIEYLDDVSRTEEHYIRINENFDCWAFKNVGATMALYITSSIAGMCEGFESLKGLEREWNAIETKCIGLGDPHCEFKVVPREIDELGGSLEKDGSVIERIHDQLMDRLMGFLLHGKPLIERPRLGTNIHVHAVFHTIGFPYLAGERYQMALRLGGAKAGKEIGEHLMDSGIKADEAVKRFLHLLDYCKMGKVAMSETIKVRENCESLYTMIMKTMPKEPACCFTTGFLNGFFSAVKNQHVKETKCIAMGDSYCEWEFR